MTSESEPNVTVQTVCMPNDQDVITEIDSTSISSAVPNEKHNSSSTEDNQIKSNQKNEEQTAPPLSSTASCDSTQVSASESESHSESDADNVCVSFSLTHFFKLMQSEQQRLQTFHLNDFKSKHVTPEALAKAGFFYMLQADRVMCAFCKMSFWGWHKGSIPVREHFELNPRCRFLNGCDVGNEPIDIGPVELIRQVFGEIDKAGTDVPPNTEIVVPSSASSASSAYSSSSQTVSFDDVEEMDDDELTSTIQEKLDPLILPSKVEKEVEVKEVPVVMPTDRTNLLRLMANEKDRLRTFEIGNWPAFYINPFDLARVGFFYTQSRDKVECAFCEIFVSDWEAGDQPLLEHLRHSPDCPLLKGEAANNVPIDANAFARTLAIVETFTPDIPFDSSPSTTDYDINSDMFLNDTYEEHRISPTSQSRPSVDLQYVTFEARKASFSSWPKESPLNPEKAAAAGFYCIGVNDYVRCFSCGGCLSDWSATDDPWIEHAKYFPKCEFLILDRGNEFIEKCRAKSKVITETPSNQTSTNDVNEEIEQLLSSEIIQELLRIKPTDPDLLKTVLFNHHNATGNTFDNLAELLDSLELTSSQSVDLTKVNETLANCADNITQSAAEANDSTTKKATLPIQMPLKTPIRPKLNQVSHVAGSTASSVSPNCSDTESDLQTPCETTDAFVCKICFDSRLGVLFVPCGHFCACSQCAVPLSSCPVCRSTIDNKLSTIF